MVYLLQETVNFVRSRAHDKLDFWLISNNFYLNQDNAMKYSAYDYHMSALTANILDAKTATISCVTFPVALQMHYVQLLAAANF